MNTQVTFRSGKFPPYDDEFLCFTDPGKPVIKKLFKKIDATEPLTRLVTAMERILAADPDIRNIEWSDGGK